MAEADEEMSDLEPLIMSTLRIRRRRKSLEAKEIRYGRDDEELACEMA